MRAVHAGIRALLLFAAKRKYRMEQNDLQKTVAAHPFFIGMTEHHIRLLADCAIGTRFARDQVIFREGETANRFYLIDSGQVALSRPAPPAVMWSASKSSGRAICSAGRGSSRLTSGTSRSRARADDGDLLLRHCPARILRARRDSRAGILQAHERSHDAAAASSAYALDQSLRGRQGRCAEVKANPDAGAQLRTLLGLTDFRLLRATRSPMPRPSPAGLMAKCTSSSFMSRILPTRSRRCSTCRDSPRRRKPRSAALSTCGS